MYTGLHVKYPLFLSDFKVTWIFSTNFENKSNTKFNQNPFNRSQVVPCERTDKHDEADSPPPSPHSPKSDERVWQNQVSHASYFLECAGIKDK